MLVPEDSQFNVTVMDVTGRSQVHTFELAGGADLANIVDPIIDRIGTEMTKVRGFLILDSPIVGYNVTHIVSVKLDLVGSAEVRAAFEEAQKTRTGFLRTR